MILDRNFQIFNLVANLGILPFRAEVEKNHLKTFYHCNDFIGVDLSLCAMLHGLLWSRKPKYNNYASRNSTLSTCSVYVLGGCRSYCSGLKYVLGGCRSYCSGLKTVGCSNFVRLSQVDSAIQAIGLTVKN